jgi:hypothetical protein
MASMLPTPDAVPTPKFTLLVLVDAPPDPAWALGLSLLATALPEAECLVLGHGRPEALAPSLRSLAALSVRPRVELRTRPLTTAAALVAGVTVARAPWVVWLPATSGLPSAESIRELRGCAGDVAFRRDTHGACLFRRDILLQLPRIPGMHRLLPELFERHAAQPRDPDSRLLRRTYVALACTMGLGWTPARRTA